MGSEEQNINKTRRVSALETARFFEERKARADFKAFDRMMKRRGGEPPVNRWYTDALWTDPATNRE